MMDDRSVKDSSHDCSQCKIAEAMSQSEHGVILAQTQSGRGWKFPVNEPLGVAVKWGGCHVVLSVGNRN